MLKTTLTICALAMMLVAMPAQDAGGRGAELQELKQALESLRAKEEALLRRIAELEAGAGDLGDIQEQADALRRRRRAARSGDLKSPPDVVDPGEAPSRRPGERHDSGKADRYERSLRLMEELRGADPHERHLKMWEDLDRQLRDAFGGRSPFGRGGRPFDLGPGLDFDFDAHTTGKSMKVESGPDGVRAEVRERGEDGKWTTKVYEAETMEELRREHPEVFGKTRGFEFRFGPGVFDRGLPPLPRDRLDLPSPRRGLGDPFGPTRPVLGVRVTDSEEGGIEVNEVTAGSLAETLGVLKGDVIVEVNGVEVGVADDVAPALLRGSEKVQVVVRRNGAEKALSGENPFKRRAPRRLKRSKDL